MTSVSLAWGEPHVFGLPDGTYLYGREFDLLPTGTMFSAGVILHGIAGVEATVEDDNVARIAADAQLELYSSRGTEPEELEPYEDDVIESFRIKQMQDAQS